MIYLLATVIGLIVAYLLWFGVALCVAAASGDKLVEVLGEHHADEI